MKIKTPFTVILLLTSLLVTSLHAQTKKPIQFPYKNSGLTDKQAAAHLLSRFTYGAKPGQIDAVVKQGLEQWFTQQLEAKLPDDTLKKLLKKYDALDFSNAKTVLSFPRQSPIERKLIEDGLIRKDTIKNTKHYKKFIQAYMDKHGLRSQKILVEQFISQKILRSAYSNNQIQEVMTSFWFNHFNVSMTKGQALIYIPSYEKDVIRPNALGQFGELLLATAKSPAMLQYLDNTRSASETKKAPAQAKKTKGLNENYAREVMELHTLGVDGGYTQKDVTEAAKILTGWTVYPFPAYGVDKPSNPVEVERNKKLGFVYDNDFVFNSNNHDKSSKIVLGKKFDANGGYEEGVALLDMLAHHSATAPFICKKIATRFVSDTPPQTLIDKMVKTFKEKNGQIKDVLITMVTATEFWEASAVRQKTKSPFELAIGSVRNLNAVIEQPYTLFQQISKMGEKIYYYQAPTGYPDKGQYWINTGSLLNRMNFGLALAEGRIPGISVNLAALNNYHEPESSQAALITYSKLIMPERDLEQTIKRLTPILNDPNLATKISEEAIKKTVVKKAAQADEETQPDERQAEINPKQNTKQQGLMLKQVVGIIIGSPEYQRR